MKSLSNWWKSLSIANKLYLVFGIMAVLIVSELLTLQFAMRKLSAARAFVGGESLWSKAQKDAVFSLQRYAVTLNKKDYEAFLEHLKIPAGDHKARVELLKPSSDLEVIRQGFLEGGLHPDDIQPVVSLLRRFYWISYMSQAIAVWTQGDELLDQLRVAGQDLHRGVGARDAMLIARSLSRIKNLNDQLTPVEQEFSYVLGTGSRWLERVVNTLLFLAVLMVESFGLTTTFLTSRELSRGLNELTSASERVGRGDFKTKVAVRSSDEIGRLAVSINAMAELLEQSYSKLEERVRLRTAELEKLVKENERLYEEARSAVEVRDEFLSIASHELRTPLTSLALQLQLVALKSRSVKSETDLHILSEYSEKSLRSAKRLTQLLDELLDLTRLRLGKFEVKRERCDLASIVSDVAAALGFEAARKGSEIHLHVDGSVIGLFDFIRINQVVTNLLSNAIKYGDGKPISVWVNRAESRALIKVQDHGIGISPENQSRIFDRFERADGEALAHGLGLGLYIAKQIVDVHGGQIRVESEPGKGSVFTVELGLS